MWKSISNLFSRSGAEIETVDHAADAMLGQLWISLIRIGVARGLTLPDAEDLAQESVVAGMQAFDPARGDFGAFCRTIMVNRAKNLFRDRKPQEPLPEGKDNCRYPEVDPGWVSYHKQCREQTDRILSDTVAKLNEEEAGFFMILAEVHEELSHGEVTEAARRAGITPQKGWDIFRKIQRRFTHLDRSILMPERPPEREDDSEVRYSLGPRVTEASCEADSPVLRPPSDIDPSTAPYLIDLRDRCRHLYSELGPKAQRSLRELLPK